MGGLVSHRSPHDGWGHHHPPHRRGQVRGGWASLDISRSEEERRWLSEGGKTDEAYLERVANQPSASIAPHHSSVTEAFARSPTWRMRAAESRERERIEQELRVARQDRKSTRLNSSHANIS